MFFQHNSAAATHGDIHWGHVSSADLLSWRAEPVALAPTVGGPDELGCWSGCVVVDDGVPTAVYTGVSGANSDLGSICLARAARDDRDLRRFVADPTPVVDSPPSGITVFRDPFVFGHGGRRYAVVGAGSPAGPSVLLYGCDDLSDWTFLGVLLDATDPVAQDAGDAVTWECPQLVRVDGRWVLVLSLLAGHGPAGVIAIVGDLVHQGDSLRFRASHAERVDQGRDFYAPAVLVEDERVLLWGWSWESGPAEDIAEAGWAGVLTLPRELDLTSDGRLLLRPAPELAGLRGAEIEGDLPDAYWVRVDCSGPVRGSTRVVLLESQRGDQLALEVDVTSGTVVLDRSAWPSVSPRTGRVTAPLRTEGQIDVVVDGSVVEVFVDGRFSITERIYPSADDHGVLKVTSPAAAGIEVSAWHLT